MTVDDGRSSVPEVDALSIAEVVKRLRERLGVKLVAYIGNVDATSAVSSWIDGTHEPGLVDQRRLRAGLEVAAIVGEKYSASTTQTWFGGLNPATGDVAPARLLREGDPNEIVADLQAAAFSFVAES